MPWKNSILPHTLRNISSDVLSNWIWNRLRFLEMDSDLCKYVMLDLKCTGKSMSFKFQESYGIVPQSKWPICLGISHAKRALMQSILLLPQVANSQQTHAVSSKESREKQQWNRRICYSGSSPSHLIWSQKVIWKMWRSHLCQAGGAIQGDVRVRASGFSSDLAVGRTCSWQKQKDIFCLCTTCPEPGEREDMKAVQCVALR